VQTGLAPPGWATAPVGELPQPTLADVQQLVAESGRAGMRVTLHDKTSGPVPDLTGRTAYRVVQEALTNARKHALGTEVHVHLSGSPGTGLTVEVRNDAAAATPTPAAGPAPDPGVGQGLVGLAERVALASGRLEHGPTADGGCAPCGPPPPGSSSRTPRRPRSSTRSAGSPRAYPSSPRR
jgi:nitrate/nitrite-specific signal transduction histidine kinase